MPCASLTIQSSSAEERARPALLNFVLLPPQAPPEKPQPPQADSAFVDEDDDRSPETKVRCTGAVACRQ